MSCSCCSSFCRLGDLIARPGVRSRLADRAAPGYDLFLPADGVAAPESVTWGEWIRPGLGSRLAGCAAPGYVLFVPADGVAAPESLTWGD